MKALTLAEIQTLGIELNTWKCEQIAESEELGKKIGEFAPVSVVHYVSDGNYYEHSQVFITGFPFPIRVSQYKGKYNLYAVFDALKNVTKYDVQNVEKQIETPQNIGVLNQKKINAWLTYWTSVYNVLLEKNNKNQGEKEAFLKSIEGLPVVWYNDKKGRILTNGIEFEFTVHETHVEKKLSIHYNVPVSVESFLKLSTNAYEVKK